MRRSERKHIVVRTCFMGVLCLVLTLSGLAENGLGILGHNVLFQEQRAKAANEVWPTLSKAKKKNLSCKSAIVMELSTGTILYQKNMHKKLYPASITKILTAMLTAERTTPNEIMTVSEKAAHGIEAGSSTVYSEPGEKLTIEQCLYGIMLQSANELCLAAGEYVSGSVDKFVALMNERVKQLGLKDTHFNNPNGLPDPKHYTSAHDMAVIARTAMKNSVFKRICGTKLYVCPKTNKHKMERPWPNHHQMLTAGKYPKYVYKYCTGGKTGFTKAAGNTLVTFAEKDGMELVCVVMKSGSPDNGEPNEYTDSTNLLNFGFEKYHRYMINEENTKVNSNLFNIYGSYFDSADSPVHLAGESSVILPKGVELKDATQTISYRKNQKLTEGVNVIGQVKYTYQGKTVGSSDILYTKKEKTETNSLDAASRKIVGKEIDEMEAKQKKDEENATFWRNIRNGLAAFFGFRVVQVILLVAVIALIIFLIVRYGKNFHMPRIHMPRFRLKKRNRSSGGYRNKRARRNYQKRQRAEKRIGSMSDGGKRRRNHRRNYASKSEKAPKAKKKSGLNHAKKHKNTKESFGKNFFDF